MGRKAVRWSASVSQERVFKWWTSGAFLKAGFRFRRAYKPLKIFGMAEDERESHGHTSCRCAAQRKDRALVGGGRGAQIWSGTAWGVWLEHPMTRICQSSQFARFARALAECARQLGRAL